METKIVIFSVAFGVTALVVNNALIKRNNQLEDHARKTATVTEIMVRLVKELQDQVPDDAKLSPELSNDIRAHNILNENDML